MKHCLHYLLEFWYINVWSLGQSSPLCTYYLLVFFDPNSWLFICSITSHTTETDYRSAVYLELIKPARLTWRYIAAGTS